MHCKVLWLCSACSLEKERPKLVLFLFFWGPSLISMQDSCNGMVQSGGNTECRPIFLNSGLQTQVWPITMVFVLTLCVRLYANYLFMFTPLEQIIGSAAAQLVAERDVLMLMTVYLPILSMMTVKQGSNLVGEVFKKIDHSTWQVKLWIYFCGRYSSGWFNASQPRLCKLLVKSFLLLVQTGIFYEFSVVENQDSETRYQSAKLAEREWVSCNSWCGKR